MDTKRKRLLVKKQKQKISKKQWRRNLICEARKRYVRERKFEKVIDKYLRYMPLGTEKDYDAFHVRRAELEIQFRYLKDKYYVKAKKDFRVALEKYLIYKDTAKRRLIFNFLKNKSNQVEVTPEDLAAQNAFFNVLKKIILMSKERNFPLTYFNKHLILKNLVWRL